MYREMVDRIAEEVKSGKSINDIEPGDILDLDAGKIAKIKAQDREVVAGTGDHALRIAFQYVVNREHYMKRKAGATEQWVDENTDHVILTLAGQRYRDRNGTGAAAASYEASHKLHHAWNDAFKTQDIRALVTVNKNSDAPDVEWFNASCLPGVTEVILPRSYTEDMVQVNGVEYRKSTPEWHAVPDGAEMLNQDGQDIAALYTEDGIKYVRVLMIPYTLFDAAGKLNSTWRDNEADIKNFCNMIAAFSSATGAVIVNDDEPTQDEKDAYESAKMMLNMSKASMASTEGKLKEVDRRIERANANLQEYMTEIVQRQRQKAEDLKVKQRLEDEKNAGIAEATGALLHEYEKIANDAPVKSAKLVPRGDGTVIEVELHPLVANTEEQALHEDGRWPDHRGTPRYRLFDALKFEMNLSSGVNDIRHIIKWIHPETVKDGFDPRCHPHNYGDGTSCWGQLSTPFAEAVANMEWHTAVQWLFNYCANVRDDEPHHTKQWMFKPAPDGWTPGWVTPDMEAETEFLKTYDPDPTYER